MKMAAEIRSMHLQAKDAKDCQPTPEAGREAWTRSSPTALRRNQPSRHLDLDCSLQNVERINSLFKPLSLWKCIRQPRELMQGLPKEAPSEARSERGG